MQIQVRINEERRTAQPALRLHQPLHASLRAVAERTSRRRGVHRDPLPTPATQVLKRPRRRLRPGGLPEAAEFSRIGLGRGRPLPEERPFGVGFSKCLYAATRCVVASAGSGSTIDTEAALARALITVEQVPECEAIKRHPRGPVRCRPARPGHACRGAVAWVPGGRAVQRPAAEATLGREHLHASQSIGALASGGPRSDGKYTHRKTLGVPAGLARR